MTIKQEHGSLLLKMKAFQKKGVDTEGSRILKCLHLHYNCVNNDNNVSIITFNIVLLYLKYPFFYCAKICSTLYWSVDVSRFGDKLFIMQIDFKGHRDDIANPTNHSDVTNLSWC